VGGYGTVLTRLIALVALAISVMGGAYLNHRDGPERTVAVVLLALVVVSGMLIASGAADPPYRTPRWAELTGIIVFTAAGGALCVAVPDGTATCLPFVAAWFVPRVPVSRTFEISLLGVDVLALWVFCFRVAAAWWPYPVVLAGIVAAYQAGLRTRERAERTEFAELMLAREQALRSERERAAAAAERERIARDLHDVLAHTLAGLAITLQNASTLLHSGQAERAQTQVDRARALAVEGQVEARQALAALAPAAGDGLASVDLAAAIDRAVRDHRAMTGGTVALSLSPLPDIPAEVSSAVLAVLREALTNVLRHAADAPIRVAALMGNGILEVTVANHDGRAAPPAGVGGMGLSGMRSRAAAVGGSLDAGPTTTGWSVRLAIPVSTADIVDPATTGEVTR
jgi:signal transduction histidine kinase